MSNYDVMQSQEDLEAEVKAFLKRWYLCQFPGCDGSKSTDVTSNRKVTFDDGKVVGRRFGISLCHKHSLQYCQWAQQEPLSKESPFFAIFFSEHALALPGEVVDTERMTITMEEQ
jgi:hypothetical protein